MTLNCVKLERAVVYIASVVPLVFSQKKLFLKKISRTKIAKNSRASEKWTREDFLQKYLTILFFASDLSRIKVNVSEANK